MVGGELEKRVKQSSSFFCETLTLLFQLKRRDDDLLCWCVVKELPEAQALGTTSSLTPATALPFRQLAIRSDATQQSNRHSFTAVIVLFTD